MVFPLRKAVLRPRLKGAEHLLSPPQPTGLLNTHLAHGESPCGDCSCRAELSVGTVQAGRASTALAAAQAAPAAPPTPADVDERGCGLHQPQLLPPNQSVGLGGQVHNQHDKVRLLQQLFHPLAVVGTNCLLLLLSPEGKNADSSTWHSHSQLITNHQPQQS